MPQTHQKHKPGHALGAINRANGDVLQVARCAHCGQTLLKAEDDANWRTAAERAQAGPRTATASLF